MNRICCLVLLGLTSASTAQTPAELMAAAEGIRPAVVEAMQGLAPIPLMSENVLIGLGAGLVLKIGNRNVIVGACSGISLEEGSSNLLVGDHTATPTPFTSGFVNLGNKLCFWRETGAQADCPPPEKSCEYLLDLYRPKP